MRNTDSAQSDTNLRNVIKINEARIQDHLGEMVRSTVEETLNGMLDAEADQLCGVSEHPETEAGVPSGTKNVELEPVSLLVDTFVFEAKTEVP